MPHHPRHPHHCEKCNKHRGGGFTHGAIFGAVIGGILGILYAPDRGEETRKKLKVVADDLTVKGKIVIDEAQDITEDVKEATAPLLAELERNIRPVLKKAKDSGKDVQFEVLEKIEQIVDEVEDGADGITKKAKKMFKGIKK